MDKAAPTNVACSKCGTRYRVDPERLTGRALNLRCAKCGNVFPVRITRPSRDVAAPWILRLAASGDEKAVASLDVVKRMIIAGEAGPDDTLSRGDAPGKKLIDVDQFATYLRVQSRTGSYQAIADAVPDKAEIEELRKAKTEKSAAAGTEAMAEPEAEPEADAETDTEPEVVSDAEPETEDEPETEPEVAPDAEPETDDVALDSDTYGSAVYEDPIVTGDQERIAVAPPVRVEKRAWKAILLLLFLLLAAAAIVYVISPQTIEKLLP